MIASYQRVALYIFFDSIERDLITKIRALSNAKSDDFLTPEERQKAADRLQNRSGLLTDDDFDLLHGLDLGEKYSILMRLAPRLDLHAREYYKAKHLLFQKAIPVRNATMHGRPLTTEEYAFGFALASDFLANPSYWPTLQHQYKEFSDSPKDFVNKAIILVDSEIQSEALNNLPIPDYEDTGFVPRPALEKELKKRIMGRHPVITVLGDGGNGKTALTLQTLYGLVEKNDHDFDAIVWVSAKSTKLTVAEISRIEDAITDSLGLFTHVADLFEPGDDSPLQRVRRLMDNNKVLLVIDNLETVIDDVIKEFALEVPGNSKIIFTSRVPLGSDLSVVVPGFTETEAMSYLMKLIDAYGITELKNKDPVKLRKYAEKLGNKPLLIKWMALGVQSGLSAEKIISNPDLAMKFCMQNIFDTLSCDAKAILDIMLVLPSATSAAIIKHITELTAEQIETGLSELLRGAIIEGQKNSDYERLFQIKFFARAYLAKTHKIASEKSAEIIAQYRKIDGVYQAARSDLIRNRYDPKTYTVRSRSEAIAAIKLKQVSNLVLAENYIDAENIITELKISNPEYFEVYRIEAFLADRMGDIPKAFASYEAALELGKSQPQLLYAYGLFIMRTSRDFPSALKAFRQALEIEPTGIPLMREAARCCLYDYNFDDAQNYLDMAYSARLSGYKDVIIFNDLQAQLYYRKADFLVGADEKESAKKSLLLLYNFLEKLDRLLIDQTMIGHLNKALPLIEKMRKSGITNLEKLETFIIDLSRLSAKSSTTNTNVPETNFTRFGRLKKEGLKPSYGFLLDTLGNDTFVSKSTVEDRLWEQLIRGEAVKYEVTQDNESGKTKAINVRKVQQ